jgi:hypothetical protein
MVQLTVCKMVEELDDGMADEWDHWKVESWAIAMVAH